jgi:hypothetical protein
MARRTAGARARDRRSIPDDALVRRRRLVRLLLLLRVGSRRRRRGRRLGEDGRGRDHLVTIAVVQGQVGKGQRVAIVDWGGHDGVVVCCGAPAAVCCGLDKQKNQCRCEARKTIGVEKKNERSEGRKRPSPAHARPLRSALLAPGWPHPAPARATQAGRQHP